MEGFWQVQAKIRALLFGRLGYVPIPTPGYLWALSYARSECSSQTQILTYPCTCIYKTTNLLLGVSRGPSMILYCCHLASNSSRCGTQRFAMASCSWKARRPNTSLDWCPHPNDRGPYRTGLSTCLGTRRIRIHFSFPRSKDQPMGKVLSFCYSSTYTTNSSARLFRDPTESNAIPGELLPLG